MPKPKKSSHHSKYTNIKRNNVSSTLEIASPVTPPLFLKCLYTNATSFNSSKRDEIEAKAAIERPHIMFFTETWFSAHTAASIANYTTHRKDRATCGGGVALYTRNDITSHELTGPNLSRIDALPLLECVSRVLTHNGERILASCVYRPPIGSKHSSPAVDAEIQALLSIVRGAIDHHEIEGAMIVGDFNLPYLSWGEDSVSNSGPDNNFGASFLEGMYDNFLHQHVTCPTFHRIAGHQGNTLDLIITDSAERIEEVGSEGNIGSTAQGHAMLTWKYTSTQSDINEPVTETPTKLAYKKGNYEQLTNFINKINWEKLFRDLDVEKCYTKFLEIYEQLCSKAIPLKGKSPGRLSPPWVDKEVKQLSNLKKQLWRSNQANKWKSISLLREYQNVCRLIKHSSKKKISAHEESIANDKDNPKRFYQYVNSKKIIRNKLNSIVDTSGVTLTEPHAIADGINKHFKSIFVHDDPSEPLPEFNTICSTKISNIRITRTVVEEELMSLDIHKSMGTDNVHPMVLKSCAAAWSIPLLHIYELSLSSGQVPSAWREANVTAIHKKGPATDPANYRPISLTSVPCKILERFIRRAITNHLVHFDLLAKQQHGFVEKKSCTTNILESMDYITSHLAKHIPVDAIYLDFAKAFDKVSHRFLLHKLTKYGIDDCLLKWIKAFLSDRRQRVIITGATSDWTPVDSGVPQGSVLGPTLFTIFINDMPSVFSKTNVSKLFADDTKLIGAISETNNLQTDLDAAVTWTNTWKMELNTKKCSVIHFGRSNPHIVYTMLDPITNARSAVRESESERDLGIIMSKDAKWKLHIQSCCYKANGMLCTLRSSFRTRNATIWKKLYCTYVRPLLEFAVPAWSPHLVKDIKALEKIQHRATRIPHSLSNLPYEERCLTMQIPLLSDRRDRGDLIQMYKFEKNINKIEWTKPLVRVPTRRRGAKTNRVLKEISTSNLRCAFFTNRVANAWNDLPGTITNAESTNMFKNHLDNHIKLKTR